MSDQVDVRLCSIAGIFIPGLINAEGLRPETSIVDVRTSSGTEKHRSGHKTAPAPVLMFQNIPAVRDYFDKWEEQSCSRASLRNVVIYGTDATGKWENWSVKQVIEGAELVHHDEIGEDFNSVERKEKPIRVQLAAKRSYEERRNSAI
jgi:hypothetical protein